MHCDICKFMCFIDQNEKPFYHCDKCGTCRIGFPEDFVHCDVCNRCIQKALYDTHRCRKNEECCCVCLGSFKDTVFSISEMGCGHQIHEHCFFNMVEKGCYTCPVCKRYAISKSQIKELTTLISQQVLDETLQIYSNYVIVHCNECQYTFPSI